MTTRVSHEEINRRIIADIKRNALNNNDFEKLKKFQEAEKEKKTLIPILWTELDEKEFQKERKRIREIQDRHFKEKVVNESE